MTFLRHTAPVMVLLLAACNEPTAIGPGGEGAPTVSFVVMKQESITITTELPGRTASYESSDVRPQVNGIIEARLFAEGSVVREGQPLYRIDSAPYVTAFASSRAGLARAEAAIASSEEQARRYGELVKINAVSRQDYENALTTAAQARADVAAQHASLKNAQIDLSRTIVRAPISGRIGRSLATTGALVSASQTQALAVIQRLDPIFVDIQQSSADLLKLRQRMLTGTVTREGNPKVQLILEDGSAYGAKGELRFADVTVDQSTGSQVIRALFPNPDGLLMPGMFVRARLDQGAQKNAMLVPQRAVGRDERGNPIAMVVGADNKVEVRLLQATGTSGSNWVVTGGLKQGDKVIVEGGMMLRPGMPVTPRAWKPKNGQVRPVGTNPTQVKQN
ncbi:efflux RND transporter periplasmic adaptor subunit [Novosphingobium sp.]|uniref:efflux RND transporter periplasmic adaptor subunit n=1 Tax=Novosphingobium sp. TaxID=1874826 RepID=UPI00262E1863|nr:efflux RND transporter periplasmic adaptor subunit [Novosphingobium sp.]